MITTTAVPSIFIQTTRGDFFLLLPEPPASTLAPSYDHHYREWLTSARAFAKRIGLVEQDFSPLVGALFAPPHPLKEIPR